jgi:hypothetical protein
LRDLFSFDPNGVVLPNESVRLRRTNILQIAEPFFYECPYC